MFIQEFRSLDDDGSFYIRRIRCKFSKKKRKNETSFISFLVFTFRFDTLFVFGEKFIHHFYDFDTDSLVEHVNRIDGQHVSTRHCNK